MELYEEKLTNPPETVDFLSSNNQNEHILAKRGIKTLCYTV